MQTLQEVRSDVSIESVNVRAFTIPTETPEADGTLEWRSTTLVLVEISANGATGLGLTYADISAAQIVDQRFRPILVGANAFAIPSVAHQMKRAVRNLGRPGTAATAISGVDNALWDLKARLLEVPLATLFGPVRSEVPVYGSGGFTNYAIPKVMQQVESFLSLGISWIKIKIGQQPEMDLERVRGAREMMGHSGSLFVDANGAYSRKQALMFAEKFSTLGVTWFEEPVSSDDLEGLHLIRDRAPAGMDITAGEYGYDSFYFRRMLEAEAVDVLQADATRCLGLSGFLEAGALSAARCLPLSAHTAPSQHVHVALSLHHLRHVEYFFDHVRIENLFFEGAARASSGAIRADLSSPGNGLILKERDVERYQSYGSRK